VRGDIEQEKGEREMEKVAQQVGWWEPRKTGIAPKLGVRGRS